MNTAAAPAVDLDAMLATDGAPRLLVSPPSGEDMRRFTALTHGRRCIVGRKKAQGLRFPHRTLVPATRTLDAQAGDIVIGGAEIYKAYWTRIRCVYPLPLSRAIGPADGGRIDRPERVRALHPDDDQRPRF